MNVKTLFLLLYSSICLTSLAQIKEDDLLIKLQFKFNEQEIKLNTTYLSDQNDTLVIDKIKFYLSDFKLIYKDNSQKSDLQKYHLIDLNEVETHQFSITPFKVKEIIGVKFNIGVDSLASVSGAMAGDLDATKGMYWAWQSGYINFKVEGKSASCLTRKNKFQFHIGGYLPPFNALREVSINCTFKNKNQINLVMDLSKLFSEIALKETNEIMIPGEEAVKMADLLPNLFSIQ